MQQNMLELCFDSFMTKPKNIHFFCTWRSFTKMSPQGIVIFCQNQLFIYLKIQKFCLTLEAELLKVKVQHQLIALPSP